PVELDLREVLRMDSAIALAREIVRQINHETGIAASGPPADPLRIDQRNSLAGPAPRQPASCRQASKSGTDDDPIGRLRTLELPRGSRFVEDLIPARALEISRQAAGMILGHHHALRATTLPVLPPPLSLRMRPMAAFTVLIVLSSSCFCSSSRPHIGLRTGPAGNPASVQPYLMLWTNFPPCSSTRMKGSSADMIRRPLTKSFSIAHARYRAMCSSGRQLPPPHTQPFAPQAKNSSAWSSIPQKRSMLE